MSLVLGIETSCDETSASVVDGRGDAATIRSLVILSQDVHRVFGGVVPEIASRAHLTAIVPVVRRALDEASVELRQLDAIAVTHAPGLVGALLVGVSYAKSLAFGANTPLVGVHHMEGHLFATALEHRDAVPPFTALLVSGGHTLLLDVPEWGAYTLLGRTRDDAAGEAYDKVAKLLGLGYPGGPAIDRLAGDGNDGAVPLPKTRLTHPDRNAPDVPGRRDFSFSGLKTSVARYVAQRRSALGLADDAPLPEVDVRDLCASFQRVVVATLLDAVFDAARATGARSVGIAGGVSANSRLRRDALARGTAAGLPVIVPALSLSTDNAAMIAAAGLRAFRAGVRGDWVVNADASLPLRPA